MKINRPKPGEPLACGHGVAKIDNTKPSDSGMVNYGFDRNGDSACLSCCAIAERDFLATRPPGILLYLSADGTTVTDWHGNFLGNVTGWHPRKDLNRPGRSWVSSAWRTVYVRDIYNRSWWGLSAGPGMYAKLRPKKSA